MSDVECGGASENEREGERERKWQEKSDLNCACSTQATDNTHMEETGSSLHQYYNKLQKMSL